jgi:uncharacterized protein (TIGR04255 family)
MFNSLVEQQAYVLDRPPLVRAVTQITFSPSARLGTADGLVQLQDGLGDSFVLQAQQGMALQINFGAPVALSQKYSFANGDGYNVAVSPQDVVLAIDQRYKTRTEFGATLRSVVAAVAAAGKINQAMRVGVRYINALPASIDQFQAWFKPEFTGWAGGSFVTKQARRTWILITQLAAEGLQPSDGGVIRYGYLPDGVGKDITDAPAATEPSFLADIDFGSSQPRTFDPDSIGDLFEHLNRVIASFFAYTLTDAGTQFFGLRRKE